MTAPSATPLGPAVSELVLDTNIVLDWLVFEDAAVQPIVRAVEAGSLRWVATQPMLDELADVLSRPLPARWEPLRATAWARAAPHCLVVAPQVPAPAMALWCSDPDDQKFIDLALARRTPLLFSRDKALLRLTGRAARFGVRVTTPRAWLPAA